MVAPELQRQGLIPVYVGLEQKKSLELKLPAFSGRQRKDVLFFTQELSTLLNAGVPLDRALSITSELTERAEFRIVVLDVLRVLKGGKIAGGQPGDASRIFLGPLRQHGARGRSVGIAGADLRRGWRSSSAPATICAATSSAR